MKRYNWIVGIVVFFLSGIVFADANSLFDNAAAPQSYRQQGQPGSSSPSPNTITPQQPSQTGSPSPNNNIPNANAIQPPKTPTIGNKNSQPNQPVSLQELQSQFSQLNQVMLMLQQQSDQKLEDLYNKNNALQAEIEKLQAALMLLNQEVNQQNQQIQTLKSIISPPETIKKNRLSVWFSEGLYTLEQKWNTELRYGVYLFIVLLLAGIVLTLVLMRRQKKKKLNQEENSSVSEDEYDFMGSKEGIPAKLNLAQAYLAMEDYEAAEKVAREIIDSGDLEYQQQALDLLSKIPVNQ